MTVYRLVGEVMLTFRLIEYIKEGTISGSFENKTNNSIGIFYWKKGPTKPCSNLVDPKVVISS